jgi:hypothetical protein
MNQKIIQKAGKYFTELEKHKIIQELISSKLTAYSDESEPPIRQSEPLKSGGFLGG